MKLKNLYSSEKGILGLLLWVPRIIWHYLRVVVRRFIADGCQHSAAALTYMTLFAIVPVLTLMYSMFSLVPAFNGLENEVRSLIFSNFLPSAGEDLQSYLDTFSKQASSLSLMGIAVLLVTCYLMLMNIEKVFNRIWATSGRRKGVVSFLLYWAILSLGPILIGATIAINTYLLSVRVFGEDTLAQGALTTAFSYLPWVLTASAFTLLYMTVPNCRVMFRNAVTGGIVATVAFELAKRGFGYFIANSAYSSIYGAFAVLPIFLLWIYLSWMIILAGAEFVRTTENFAADVRGDAPGRVVASLWLLWRLSEAQRQGRELSDLSVRRAGMTSAQWQEIRDLLLRKKIITITEKDNYVLLKPLDQISVWDIVSIDVKVLDDRAPILFDEAVVPDWVVYFRQQMADLKNSSANALSLSVAELFSYPAVGELDAIGGIENADIYSSGRAGQIKAQPKPSIWSSLFGRRSNSDHRRKGLLRGLRKIENAEQ